MPQQDPRRDAMTDRELLAASELFDEEFYLATYPDVAAAGIDPTGHYLQSGAREGRDPSAEFSTTAYWKRYPDVQATGWNPLVHFLREGEAEGRLLNPFLDDVRIIRESGLFDDAYYRHFRPDVPDDVEPLHHFLAHGADEGFDPGEGFSTSDYVRQHPDIITTGLNPLIHYLRHGRAEGRSTTGGRPLYPEFRTLYDERWSDIGAFPVLRVTGVGPRVTVLTDSVAASSLFGGVGTALILGMLLANRYDASLRLVTRHDSPDPGVIASLERAAGITLLGDVEIAHLPLTGPKQPLLMGERELVLTTSWWSTRAALDSTLSKDEIVYLLQEDERMFYPFGDERLLCTETLDDPGLTTVVNTQRLMDHMVGDFPRLDRDGVSFEPAFPAHAASAQPPAREGKRRFFFYSRPQNSRNLFWRGGLALSRAIEENVLDPDEWELHFVGRATPDLSLPRGVRPELHEGLSWAAYQALVGSMDAALVLMDTPHPSYPPLDLAAAGAAVLTNRHPGKEDLSDVSENILVADLGLETLVEGVARAVALGLDDNQRAANRERDSIGRDWTTAMGAVLAALDDRLRGRLGVGGHVH